MDKKRDRKRYYHISTVARMFDIHPQTLRLYEREGLLKPSRSEKNTRLYSEDDLEQLRVILSLTRDLGVNLAGIEIILNLRAKIEQIEKEVNEFLEYVKREFFEGREEEFEMKKDSLVQISPAEIIKVERAEAEE